VAEALFPTLPQHLHTSTFAGLTHFPCCGQALLCIPAHPTYACFYFATGRDVSRVCRRRTFIYARRGRLAPPPYPTCRGIPWRTPYLFVIRTAPSVRLLRRSDRLAKDVGSPAVIHLPPPASFLHPLLSCWTSCLPPRSLCALVLCTADFPALDKLRPFAHYDSLLHSTPVSPPWQRYGRAGGTRAILATCAVSSTYTHPLVAHLRRRITTHGCAPRFWHSPFL